MAPGKFTTFEMLLKPMLIQHCCLDKFFNIAIIATDLQPEENTQARPSILRHFQVSPKFWSLHFLATTVASYTE